MMISAALALLLALQDVDGRAAAPLEKVRVACVGDSITYGAAVEKREQNAYPAVLGGLLGPAYEVRNFGVSGATLLKKGDKPYWKDKALQQVGDFGPNIVVVLLGTNDSKPQNWKFKDELEADARALVRHFKALPSRPKVLVALPAAVVKPSFGIAEERLRLARPILEKVAREEMAAVVGLQEAVAAKELFVGDGVHPNVAGAKRIAEAVFAALTGK